MFFDIQKLLQSSLLFLFFPYIQRITGNTDQIKVHREDVLANTNNNNTGKSSSFQNQNSNVESTTTSSKKNILLLITDDQDAILGSFDHMPQIKRLLQEQGVTFQNGFVHTPICCPSRSSILTGRYLHNCDVQNNSIAGNCYGFSWITQMEDQGHTFAVPLQNDGYTTAYTGKYLNQYGYNGSNAIPKGWDHWWGLVGNSRYYNYSMVQGDAMRQDERENGRRVEYGDTYPKDYLPHVMQQRVLQWMQELSEPWLIVAAWPTPHGPFTPAPEYKGSMENEFPPRDNNYNTSAIYMQQKHWFLRQLNPMSNEIAKEVDQYYQLRLEALRSIDDYIAQMMHTLQANKAENRTVVLYTSDNGYQFGQHRLSMDKRHLYENDIRVPFVIQGPDVLRNTTLSAMVANIDIGPTLLDIAGIWNLQNRRPSMHNNITDGVVRMDGQSFWNLAQGMTDSSSLRRDLLISYHGEGFPPCGLSQCPYSWKGISWIPDSSNNTYHCVRTLWKKNNEGRGRRDTLETTVENSIYCRFEDDENFVEYYDLESNPYQLQNDVGCLSPVQRQLYEQRLEKLLQCQGAACHHSEFDVVS